MATYEYDEAGIMAAYFLITFLALILVPMSLSAVTRKSEKPLHRCQCNACSAQQKRITRSQQGVLSRLGKRTYFLIGGWSLFVFVSYRVAGAKTDNKIYDPFEILGISSATSESDIKSHFKKLSRLYHPDKVRATANKTLEDIQNRFVEITKAYKSLTDETIRENWIKYNNPDGPQRMSMGIALPKWVIEGKNNIWVLGLYGLVFGGALPALVGRWWFGSRQKTKDGVHSMSAATFFKSIREESTADEVVATLGKAFLWEYPGQASTSKALDNLEKKIEKQLREKWKEVKRLAQNGENALDDRRRKALILLYAHLLRIEIGEVVLQKEQSQILLQTPSLLNAMLTITLSRNWLLPVLAIMRLHSHLVQAVPLLQDHEQKGDKRVEDAKRFAAQWGRIEIVDATFKVIGERVVTPLAITHLVIKLRIIPPGPRPEKMELSAEEIKDLIKRNETKDEQFLLSKADSEEQEVVSTGAAHAPFWPADRIPSWWVVLADEKTLRVVVPPFKVSDVPLARPDVDRDYRSYKIQFQGPQATGIFTWKVYLISDTYVGEEAARDITMKVEEPVKAEQPSEDEISDPDEDTLAGQMAAMRGGPVKKRKEIESDDSSTDDDAGPDGDSSDSD